MSGFTQKQLKKIIHEFADGFNRDNLDFVMNHFTEDAVYIEFNVKVWGQA